jgi:hypothetical protein
MGQRVYVGLQWGASADSSGSPSDDGHHSFHFSTGLKKIPAPMPQRELALGSVRLRELR